MKISFTLNGNILSAQKTMLETMSMLYDKYDAKDIQPEFKRGAQSSVTVIDETNVDSDNFKNFDDIGEDNEAERLRATEFGLYVIKRFSSLDKEAKLRLFHGQEHALLSPDQITKAQRFLYNKDKLIENVWGKKPTPKITQEQKMTPAA